MTDSDKLIIALDMLAWWVMLVDKNGTGWDDWDEGYKDAAYRDTPIRKDIDERLDIMKKQWID